MTTLAEKADTEGSAWLDAYIEREGLNRDALTKADWFLLSRKIPCTIRCWWIGEPVDVKPGDPCPECGTVQAIPDIYERLRDEG